MRLVEQMVNEDHAIKLFKEHYGFEPERVEYIAGAGSSRIYFRLYLNEKESVIATVGFNIDENKAFIYLSHHFASKNLPTPRIIAVNSDFTCYLQTDCGSESLYSRIIHERKNDESLIDIIPLLEESLSTLVAIQIRGAEGIDWSKCYPLPSMDRQSVMWDLNYFKYCFLKPSGIELNEKLLEVDVNKLADDLLNPVSSVPTFQVRDFQSRNILLTADETNQLTVIDFQGGRAGLPMYDAASFIWQSRADFNASLRDDLTHHYKTKLLKYLPEYTEKFDMLMGLCVAFRNMQTLGAYGFRGLIENKSLFISALPKALSDTTLLLNNHFFDNYPYLADALRHAIELLKFKFPVTKTVENDNRLTVMVSSFSFHKGIPLDPSGNGGGFVFDCRAMHNPGRYAEYKRSTGRDENVISFLKSYGECDKFVDNAFTLIEPSVKRYLERGFTNLTINFGCTGGQHRSVYCAELLATQLHLRYPQLRVLKFHREQGITEEMI